MQKVVQNSQFMDAAKNIMDLELELSDSKQEQADMEDKIRAMYPNAMSDYVDAK